MFFQVKKLKETHTPSRSRQASPPAIHLHILSLFVLAFSHERIFTGKYYSIPFINTRQVKFHQPAYFILAIHAIIFMPFNDYT